MHQTEDPVLAIFEVRGQLASAKKFIKANNKVAVKSALRSCLADAKRFFDGDQIAIGDFRTKLQEVYNAFKTGESQQAYELTERLFAQIEMLITHLTDQGAFPESAVELLSDVMVERVIEQKEAGISEFDMAAGHYCKEFFPEIPADRDDLMFGMCRMLTGIFLGKFADGRPSIELIKAKRAVDEESENSIEIAVVFAKSLADKKILTKLEELSDASETPVMVHLANRVVAVCEKVVGKPPDDLPITRGSVSSLGWMVIQTGLCLQHLIPRTTRKMAEELNEDYKFKLITAMREFRRGKAD